LDRIDNGNGCQDLLTSLSPIAGEIFALIIVNPSVDLAHPYLGRVNYYLGLVAQSESDITAKYPFSDQQQSHDIRPDQSLCALRLRIDWEVDVQEGAVGKINDGIASLRGRLTHVVRQFLTCSG
jgi:hypothetical protein